MTEFWEFVPELIESVRQFAMANVHIAPLVIFGILLLAGFNLPISEDLMVFISAILAVQNPQYTVFLFIGVFLGAYGSDVISYWLGRLLGPSLFRIKLFNRVVKKEKLHKMALFFNKYGMAVLIVGRLIPFGVRNAMFITAGLGKSHFGKFAVADLFASLITVSCYFTLFYQFGEQMIAIVKKSNIVIFGLFIASCLGFYVHKKWQSRRRTLPQNSAKKNFSPSKTNSD